MPKVSEQYLQARRDQILKAAFTCFARNGFHETTMREICEEAELSPGAVYRYFESKQAIIQAIGQQGRGQRSRALDAAINMEDAPLALKALIERYFAMITDESAADAVRLDIDVWSEALRDAELRETVRVGHSEVLAQLTKLIEDGQERRQIAGGWDAYQASRMFTALLNGLELQVALDPSADLQAMVPTVVALFAQLTHDSSGPEARK